MVSMGATADGVEGGIGVLFFFFLGWGITESLPATLAPGSVRHLVPAALRHPVAVRVSFPAGAVGRRRAGGVVGVVRGGLGLRGLRGLRAGGERGAKRIERPEHVLAVRVATFA